MDLQQRIESLEKERWVYLGLGALAVLAGLLGALLGSGVTGRKAGGGSGEPLILHGTPGHNVITVEDASGNTRFALGLNNDSLVMLQFYDQEKKRRQSIGLSAGADPEFRMFNNKGTMAAELTVDDSGLPRLTMYDNLKTKRQSLGLDVNGDPRLEFFDFREKVLYTAPPPAATPTPPPPKK